MFEQSKWVTYPKEVSSCTFKKDYQLNKAIKKVTAYITSMGWYLLYINGNLVNTDVFTPGYTSFKKRVQFQEYDISNLVSDSLSISVKLGEGWSGGKQFSISHGRYFNYYPCSLIYDIVVEYVDGEISHLTSDDSMDVYTNDIVSTTIYNGEVQDCTRNIEYLGKSKLIDINSRLIPQEGEHIVFGERFKAKKMWRAPNGDLLIDFGQNFSGMVFIHIKGKRGDIISYTLAEVLDKDGNFYRDNYRSAEAYYSFVLSGEEETLRPLFSFMGGRYIKLIDCPDYVTIDCFEAVFVHSEMDKTCWFNSGDEKINRLYLNTLYGQLGNYLDIPTDCPQRDERLGWTADAQVFCKTGAIHFNVLKFFKKWLRDLVLEQGKEGEIDGVVPSVTVNANPGSDKPSYFGVSTGWGDACIIIPYELYMAYGDKSILEENLDMCEKWVNYLANHTIKPHIVNLDFSFGDWLALDKVQDGKCQGLTRFDMMSTAYYAYDLSLLIKIYKILGKDSIKYENELKEVKKAYQKEFIKDGHMIGEKATLFSDMDRTCYTQTGLVMTLFMNMCEDKDRPSLIKDLANLVKECGNKLSTGFIGTPYILYALSENGYKDVALDLLFQEEYPSWLYSVNKGATTMWEHYDGVKEDGSFWFESMNSFNHYAYGAVFGWMFNNIVGIVPIKPGYKEIKIKPITDKRLGFVDCKFITKYGEIEVHWEIKNNNYSYRFIVPNNIKATIELENGKVKILENGGTFEETYNG